MLVLIVFLKELEVEVLVELVGGFATNEFNANGTVRNRQRRIATTVTIQSNRRSDLRGVDADAVVDALVVDVDAAPVVVVDAPDSSSG
jgi:hypothetical protein